MSRAAVAANKERKKREREVEKWAQELDDLGWDAGHQLVACDDCGLEQVQLLDAWAYWHRTNGAPVPPVVCVLCGCATAHHVRVLARP